MTTLDVSTPIHICPKCQQEKPLTIEFWFERTSRTKKSWMKHACRNCINDERRESEKLKAREKRSTPEGLAKIVQAAKRWKNKKREQDLEGYRKIRQEEHRRKAEREGRIYTPRGKRIDIERAYDQIIESNARDAFNWWFAKKTDEQVAAWYAAAGKPWLNPRLTRAEAFRIRYRFDSEFNTYQRMRRQLKKFLYNDGVTELIRYGLNNNTESTRAEELLGYTIGELRMHIERQFTKGMNWNKFMKGEIHIDHIHPKASFDLSDQEQWRICWSLPNLRPLWAKENRVKSAKVMTLL